MDKVILDVGSGPHPKPDATVRMDVHQWPGVDVVHDLHKFPYPFDDNSVDKIYFGDVIEHLYYFIAPRCLKEFCRILKPGGVLEVTCPDFRWICERIAFNDWNEKANVDWLRRHEDPWDNAMDYFFGGWRHPDEYKIPGMGHINAFDEPHLIKVMNEAGFEKCVRVPDERNPEPARGAVLKVIGNKP